MNKLMFGRICLKLASTIIMLTLTACGTSNAQTTEMPNVAFPSASFTPSSASAPESTAASTETPTETPPVTVDVTQPPDKWDLSQLPTDQRAELQSLFADSSTASPEARAAFDKLVTESWKARLKEAEVANVESLKDYALLDAILTYTEANGIHDATLPIALHRLIVTDPSNLVPTNSRRPSVPESTDAWYGLDHNSSGMSLEDLKAWSSSNFKTIYFYGEEITRTEKDPPFTMTPLGSGARGDLLLLVNLPGIDPVKEQGALLLMYDSAGNRHYFEVNMVYSSGLTANSNDLCEINQGVGKLILYEQCLLSVKLDQTIKMKDLNHSANRPVTHQEIIDYLSGQGAHHVEIRSDMLGNVGPETPTNIWQNGIGVGTYIAFIPKETP